MTILITTPTGKIGSTVLRELLAPEFFVRTIAPQPSLLPLEVRRQVQVFHGSLDDAGVLRRALAGVDAVFWCAPPPSPGEQNVQDHYERFARTACLAIRAAGTSRVINLSALGTPVINDSGQVAGLHAAEKILNDSGAAIRHLRCGWLMENLLCQAQSIARQGCFSFPLPGHLTLSMVAANDIADVALQWLVRQNWTYTALVGVRGPERLTLNHAAAIIEQALERPLQYRMAPSDLLVGIQSPLAAGLQASGKEAPVEISAGFSQDFGNTTLGMIESTTTTTLAMWAERVLFPAVEKWRRSPEKEGVADTLSQS